MLLFLSVLFFKHRPNLVGRKPRLLVVLQLEKRPVERTVYTAHVRPDHSPEAARTPRQPLRRTVHRIARKTDLPPPVIGPARYIFFIFIFP